MYTIDFYEASDGHSDVLDFLEELRKKSSTGKDARIQYQQLARYIWLLQENGTHLSQEITKHLVDDIWDFVRETIAFSTSFLKMIPLYYSITSERSPRRHLEEK